MSQTSTSSTLVLTLNDASSIEFEEILLQSGAFSLFLREPTHEADRIEILAKKLMEQAQKIVKQSRKDTKGISCNFVRKWKSIWTACCEKKCDLIREE